MEALAQSFNDTNGKKVPLVKMIDTTCALGSHKQITTDMKQKKGFAFLIAEGMRFLIKLWCFHFYVTIQMQKILMHSTST